ncbi:PLDc N-terminal domain-containing protein [Daejeonella sp.]|uniref:PLDc N-terminal domain-containing protein n=1 Tax=Daejeonella sp. TaxID=2805397 RepID=UPI0037BF6CFE
MICTLLNINIGLWETVMIAFAVIALFLIIPFAIFDTVRSKDLSTTQKFLWILFILIAPYLGAIVYLFWGRKQKAI